MNDLVAAIAHGFRRTAVPLAWYYAVTLALPLANGAARAGASFVAHALVVLVVPALLISIVCATRSLFRLWRDRQTARPGYASYAQTGRSTLETSSSPSRS